MNADTARTPSVAPRTTFSWAVRGILVTEGPAVGLVALALAERTNSVPESSRLTLAVAAGVASSVAGLLLDRARAVARILLLLAFSIPAVLGIEALTRDPMIAFAVGAGGATTIGLTWMLPLSDVAPAASETIGRAIATRWSAYASFGIGLVIATLDRGDAFGSPAAMAGFVITLAHAARWSITAFEQHPRRAKLIAGLVGVAIPVAAVIAIATPSLAVAFLATTSLVVLWVCPTASAVWPMILEHPARLLVATFAALCFGGTALLALPLAASTGASVGILDALFTSVSAVCVTGLIVPDTPNAFGAFGQAAIALLIQLGGLGIMTFYSTALSVLGRRLSLRHESAIAGAMSIEDRSQLFGQLGGVLRVTLVSEAMGALVLFLAFLRHDASAGQALWRATFTSISAFCNAGFALQSDSLIGYNRDPLVIHTVGALIVLGGLSPVVVTALPRLFRRRRATLQAKLILSTTAALLLFGFVAFAAFEWTNTLDDMSLGDRLTNAWFQSITPRTAGFNSIDTAAMRPATQTLTIALMFIGGSPGSTAGGIKTTTFAILALAVMTALRRRSAAEVFGRRIGHATVYKAAAVLTLGVVASIGALLALQLTQTIELDLVVFEVVSALATVGLSIGATPLLDAVGKLVIVACMFAGRVGPLTLFLFLTEQGFSPAGGHPEEEVDVG